MMEIDLSIATSMLTFNRSETNLKCRQSLPETVSLGDNIAELAAFNGKSNNNYEKQ